MRERDPRPERATGDDHAFPRDIDRVRAEVCLKKLDRLEKVTREDVRMVGVLAPARVDSLGRTRGTLSRLRDEATGERVRVFELTARVDANANGDEVPRPYLVR
jgi:hypothetical protein